MKSKNNKISTIKSVSVLTLIAVLSSLTVFALSNNTFADCAGVETNIINCDENASGGIFHLLSIVINILTMGVGVLAVLGITYAGIQYLTSSGDEQKMVQAKKRIYNVVLGLLAYGILWTGTQWLIPGGLFNSPATSGEESSVSDRENRDSREGGDAEGESGSGTESGEETNEPAGNEDEEFDRPASEIL